MNARLIRIVLFTLLCAPAGLVAQDAADAAWSSGEHARARELYATRVAGDSSDVQALHRLALLLGWQGEYRNSVALFDRVMTLAPSNVVRMERANVLAWSREYPRALADIEDLLRSDPTSREAWTGKARFLSWAGRYDESLVAYERLAQLTPGDTGVAHGRARVLSWAGRLGAAEEAYRAILAANPDDVEALRGLARVASWRGDLHTGEQLWRRAIDADPTSADARMGLSQVLRWGGRPAAALREAEAAAELEPANRDVQLQLAWAESAFRPRVAPSFAIESDSDDNRLLTSALTISGYLGRRVALSAHGYLRRAEDGRDVAALESRGVMVGARADVGAGWTVAAAGGFNDRSVAGAGTQAVWSASLASAPWRTVSGTLGYARSVFDATAPLIERGVSIDDATAGFAFQLAPVVRAELGGGYTRFRGEQDNERRLGRAALEVTAARWLRLRPRATVFGFEHDLEEGYFDPDRYVLAELGVGVDRYRGAWAVGLEVAPGAQQVGSEGDVQGALSARARLGYTIAPGRELGIGFTLSNLGMDRLDPEAAGYRYGAAVLSAAWTF